MSIDYSLLDRLSKSSCVAPIKPHTDSQAAPQTAFGRRILALSEAFHAQSMSDEQIEAYLTELVAACEAQWSRIEALRGCTSERSEMIDFLEGIIEVAENFDLMSHQDVEDAVNELEGEFLLTVVHLGTSLAA